MDEKGFLFDTSTNLEPSIRIKYLRETPEQWTITKEGIHQVFLDYSHGLMTLKRVPETTHALNHSTYSSRCNYYHQTCLYSLIWYSVVSLFADRCHFYCVGFLPILYSNMACHKEHRVTMV